MKRVLVLGSTGSIGVNTLNVIREYPELFKIEGLSGNSNIKLLKEQIEEFHPSFAVVCNKSGASQLKEMLTTKCDIYTADEGLVKAAEFGNYDIIVNALVGFTGLEPTIQAIRRGKRIALANKETLVVAGELITILGKEFGSELLPIDSEHSAIFQCIVGEQFDEIEKLIITASGGPFLNRDKEGLSKVSVLEALNHPNWKMGNKITIDSATMMNKGLEVIEAHWLFGLPKEKIEVVVHPQSIIHSMVEFIDGSIKAQLGIPDMKLPIRYALSYPKRLKTQSRKTKIPEVKNLTFYEPDLNKFECLQLAYDAMNSGGNAPCIMNAANEIAVDMFLKGRINFLQIPQIIKASLNKIENTRMEYLEEIIECDRRTREFAINFFKESIN